MSPKHLFLIIFGLIFFNNTSAWRLFKFDFPYFEFIVNPLLVKGNGSIGLNSAGHKVINAVYESKVTLNGPIFVNMVFTTVSKTILRPIKMNVTIDICETFKNPRLPPIAIAVYKAITTRTNMPLKCPVEPKPYHMLGVGANEEDFPPYFPLGLYRIVLTFDSQIKKKHSHLGTILLRLAVLKNTNKKPTRAPREKGAQ